MQPFPTILGMQLIPGHGDDPDPQEIRRFDVKANNVPVAADYLSATELEELTGTPASTWRYWAHIGTGPASFKLGRRRVWKRSTVQEWLHNLEAVSQ